MGAKLKADSRRATAAAATRSKMLACARDLFQAHGYAAVSMRQAAAAAGVSTGAIFVHFEGKDALFEAAMGRKPPLEVIIGILRGRPGGCQVCFSAEDADRLLADLVGSEGA